MNIDELLAEARDALGRVNTNAFEHDLLFQYRGGVLGREITLIVRDLADGIEELLDRVEKAEQERDEYRDGTTIVKLTAAEQALQRVRELHQYEVIGVHEGYGEELWCPTCEHDLPCPTIKALEGDE